MSQSEKSFDLKAAKKKISERTKDFEKSLMEARNPFEMVRAFDRMLSVLNSEIDSWINEIGELQTIEEQDEFLTNTEAGQHISGLQELVSKISEFRSANLPQALAVQQAMINSHQLKEPVIFPQLS